MILLNQRANTYSIDLFFFRLNENKVDSKAVQCPSLHEFQFVGNVIMKISENNLWIHSLNSSFHSIGEKIFY
jgi:hypothetical protein